MTLVEVVVAAAIALSALGLWMELWRTSDRLDRTAGSSASLAAAASLKRALVTDLRQIGQSPDAVEIVRPSDGVLSFHVAHFDGPEIRLRPVRYERVPARDGLHRLERIEADSSGRRARRILPDVPLALPSCSSTVCRSGGSYA